MLNHSYCSCLKKKGEEAVLELCLSLMMQSASMHSMLTKLQYAQIQGQFCLTSMLQFLDPLASKYM